VILADVRELSGPMIGINMAQVAIF